MVVVVMRMMLGSEVFVSWLGRWTWMWMTDSVVGRDGGVAEARSTSVDGGGCGGFQAEGLGEVRTERRTMGWRGGWSARTE